MKISGRIGSGSCFSKMAPEAHSLQTQGSAAPTPKFTLAIISRNQEQFIAHALQSLLRQDCLFCEILAIDNGSTDRTGALMQEGASLCPSERFFTVIRSQHELNAQECWRLVAEHARGEWIIQCDGDDVLLPERVSSLADFINRLEHRPGAVFSDAYTMDVEGVVSEQRWHNHSYSGAATLEDAIGSFDHYVLGTSSMYRADTNRIFQTVLPGIWQGDRVVAFRALILGGIAFLPKPLVYYRRYGNNAWKSDYSHLFVQAPPTPVLVPQIELLLRQAILDMECAVQAGLLAERLAASYKRFLRLHLLKLKSWRMLEVGRKPSALAVLLFLIVSGHAPRTNAILFLKHSLPGRIYRWCEAKLINRLPGRFWRLLARNRKWAPL